MQLSFLQFLFFLLLFAYRIKANAESFDNDINNLDIISWPSDVDDIDNDSEEQSVMDDDDPPAVGSCSKKQFQCVSNGKCIEKYMFCDYIVDCEDASDEISCGTCNFQNGNVPNYIVVHN